MCWGDPDWVVETIFKAVGVFVRLREGVAGVEGKKTRNRAAGARLHTRRCKQRLHSFMEGAGVLRLRWIECWGCSFNHSVQDGVGGAHLGTCTSPLFPHSLFISPLPQTFHSFPLRPIDGLSNSRLHLHLVVVNVEAKTCHLDLVSELRKIYLCCLLAPSTILLKSRIYFYVHSI